jgi:hypothetical protein
MTDAYLIMTKVIPTGRIIVACDHSGTYPITFIGSWGSKSFEAAAADFKRLGLSFEPSADSVHFERTIVEKFDNPSPTDTKLPRQKRRELIDRLNAETPGICYNPVNKNGKAI